MTQAQGTTGRLLADRYRLGEILGQGGMGTVWRAVDETLGREVAVKELRFPGNVDDDEKRRLITRTLREAKATARIRSTGAVTVYDVVEEDNRPWIVMELVEGRSLSDAIRLDGPLGSRRAAEVGLAVLDVLRAAHREGILHRDVKPSNVLIADDGRVVLTDFGIAQVEGDPSVTSTGMLVGAPSYISPERARGQKPGPASDLWSLGALLYAAVEGRPPYDRGAAIATLTAVMTEPLESPSCGGALADAICGLLIKDPAKRLDDKAVRTLLTEAATGPETPPGESTKTLTVPADPQPLPTDAGPALRSAAAEDKVLGSLRSVRNAAARREPAAGATTFQAPSGVQAPLMDLVSRRTMVIVAMVVLAIVGTVLVILLTHTSGNGSNSGGSDGSGGNGKSAAPSQSLGGTPTQSAADVTNGIPAGFVRYQNDQYHFALDLPANWHRIAVAGQNSGVIFAAMGGTYPRVQIDYTSQPRPDAAAAWRQEEPAVAQSSTDYHLLGIRTVHYRDFTTVADWEFTRVQGGTPMHVLNRGMANSRAGYAVMFTCPTANWDATGCSRLRQVFFSSFTPLG